MFNPVVMIITQNQENYIEDLIKNTSEFERFWVVDRSKDNTTEKLTQLKENFIENKEGDGFLAGKMRDIGLDILLEKDYDIIIMLDGNRIPKNLNKDLIEKEAKEFDCGIALCEKDIRKEIYNNEMSYMHVATAGLFVKTSFLKKIRNLSFMENRCFHKDFDGSYGEEDIFLGYCLYSVGATVRVSNFEVKGTMPSNSCYTNLKNTDLKNSLIKNNLWMVEKDECPSCNIYI